MTIYDERIQMIAELSSRAAHDVRTPLTSISGFAELLSEDATLSELSRDSAQTILSEARSLMERLDRYFAEVRGLVDPSSFPSDE